MNDQISLDDEQKFERDYEQAMASMTVDEAIHTEYRLDHHNGTCSTELLGALSIQQLDELDGCDGNTPLQQAAIDVLLAFYVDNPHHDDD